MNARLALLVTVILLFACTASAGTGKTVCRLAYTAKGHYAPMILALRKGWIAAENVDFQEVKLGMSAGVAAAEALVSGSADLAVMGDVPGIISMASARPCVLVAAYGGGEGMHSIVAGAKAGLARPEDLVGKRLGVQFGSSTHGAVYLFLEHHHVDPAKVVLVNMPQKDLVEALASGSLDALAASEPTPALAVEKVPGAKKLATLSGLGNDYPLVLMASAAFADAHPQAVKAVVAGMRRAVEWINADPKAAAEELAKATGVPPAMEQAFFGTLEWKVRLDAQVVASLEQTAAFLKREGKLKQLPDITAHSRPEFLLP